MVLIRLDLDQLERELAGASDDFMLELANELVNQLKVESPTGATGDLQRSWQIFRQGDGVIYVGSRLPYALFVHTGTKPHWPPLKPLVPWARRVVGAESFAYVLQRKIAEEGTEANPYLDRAMDNAIRRVT